MVTLTPLTILLTLTALTLLCALPMTGVWFGFLVGALVDLIWNNRKKQS